MRILNFYGEAGGYNASQSGVTIWWHWSDQKDFPTFEHLWQKNFCKYGKSNLNNRIAKNEISKYEFEKIAISSIGDPCYQWLTYFKSSVSEIFSQQKHFSDCKYFLHFIVNNVFEKFIALIDSLIDSFEMIIL